MGLPTVEGLLATAYRIRSEAAEALADERVEGTPKLIKEWERMFAKVEQRKSAVEWYTSLCRE